eukprot:5410336-Prymnesium_polylepis.1
MAVGSRRRAVVVVDGASTQRHQVGTQVDAQRCAGRRRPVARLLQFAHRRERGRDRGRLRGRAVRYGRELLRP